MKFLVMVTASLIMLGSGAKANPYINDRDFGDKVIPSIVTTTDGGRVTASDGVSLVTTSEYLPSDFAMRQSK